MPLASRSCCTLHCRCSKLRGFRISLQRSRLSSTQDDNEQNKDWFCEEVLIKASGKISRSLGAVQDEGLFHGGVRVVLDVWMFVGWRVQEALSHHKILCNLVRQKRLRTIPCSATCISASTSTRSDEWYRHSVPLSPLYHRLGAASSGSANFLAVVLPSPSASLSHPPPRGNEIFSLP